MADPSPPPSERIRNAERLGEQARLLLERGEVYEAAALAYRAVKEALLAAASAHALPFRDDDSLLAAAEALSRATRFGCIPCRFSSVLLLGQDLRRSGYPPDRIRRMIPKALEISENLALLAAERIGIRKRTEEP